MTRKSLLLTGVVLLAFGVGVPVLASGPAAQPPAPAAPVAAVTPATPVASAALAAPVAPAPAEASTTPVELPKAAAPAQPTPPTHASAQVEPHIARLRQQLKITAAQAKQWDAFAQVMRDNAQHMESVSQATAASFGKMNAVKGLQTYEQVTQAHLEDLQKLEPAFEALYATFSDSQKKAADAMFRTRSAERTIRNAAR